MSTPSFAMGKREYDYLTVSNAWAKVTITRVSAREFVLDDDARGTFPSLAAALTEAWTVLADFEVGRCD